MKAFSMPDRKLLLVVGLVLELALASAKRMVNDFRSEGVDTLELKTDAPYMAALQRFFKTRERRRV